MALNNRPPVAPPTKREKLAGMFNKLRRGHRREVSRSSLPPPQRSLLPWLEEQENAPARYSNVDRPPSRHSLSAPVREPPTTTLVVYVGEPIGYSKMEPWRVVVESTAQVFIEHNWRMIVAGCAREGLGGYLVSTVRKLGGHVHWLKEPEDDESVTDSVESSSDVSASVKAKADGAIFLPGGFGTAEMLLSMASHAVKRRDKFTLSSDGPGQPRMRTERPMPVLVLNHEGFFDSLLAWMAEAKAKSFVSDKVISAVKEVRKVEDLADALSSMREPTQRNSDWRSWPEPMGRSVGMAI